MPCPQGIDIPRLFSFLNDASLFDNLAEERRAYSMEVGAGQTAPASACAECGQCVEACPQQLDVTRELAGWPRRSLRRSLSREPRARAVHSAPDGLEVLADLGGHPCWWPWSCAIVLGALLSVH